MVALSIRKLMGIKKYFNIFQLDFFFNCFISSNFDHSQPFKVKHSVPFPHKLKRAEKKRNMYHYHSFRTKF